MIRTMVIVIRISIRVLMVTGKPSGTTKGSPHVHSDSIIGRPIPRKILKTLLPTALAQAMSPSPSFATTIELRASGIDVPAARTTRPMLKEPTPRWQPIFAARETMAHEVMPIQMMHIVNDSE